MVTVAGIIAGLTAIAVPSLTTLNKETGLPSAQREIMGALYLARSSAITYNAQRVVTINPSTKVIQITDQAGTTTFYTRNLNGYAGISVDGSNTITVTFDSRGLLTPANNVTINLNGTSSQRKSITVYATGKAAAS